MLHLCMTFPLPLYFCTSKCNHILYLHNASSIHCISRNAFQDVALACFVLMTLPFSFSRVFQFNVYYVNLISMHLAMHFFYLKNNKMHFFYLKNNKMHFNPVCTYKVCTYKATSWNAFLEMQCMDEALRKYRMLLHLDVQKYSVKGKVLASIENASKQGGQKRPPQMQCGDLET